MIKIYTNWLAALLLCCGLWTGVQAQTDMKNYREQLNQWHREHNEQYLKADSALKLIPEPKTSSNLRVGGTPATYEFICQDMFLSGANLAWGQFSGDVGFGANPDINYFNTFFADIKAAGGNSIRWWLHTDAAFTPNFQTNGNCTGLHHSMTNQQIIDQMEDVLDAAYANGILVDVCLFSFDMLQDDANKGWTDIDLAGNRNFLTSATNVDSYIQNALTPMVNALKDHPALLCWEVFNEPEGMASEHGWTGNQGGQFVSMSDIQMVVNKITGAIHRLDDENPVTNGCWSFIAMSDVAPGATQNYYRDDRLIAAGGDQDGTLDFYQVHYYDWAGTELSPFHHDASFWGLDKPIMVAEFHAEDTYGVPGEETYDELYHRGYFGAWGWQYNESDLWAEIQAGMAPLYSDHASYIDFNKDYNCATGADCAGVEGGDAYLDDCGECVGGTTGEVACTQDCNEEWGGTAAVDDCGICAGGSTGITPNSTCNCDITVTDQELCAAGSVTLEATGAIGTVQWYADATGGDPLASGATFTTSVSGNTTFYAVDGGQSTTNYALGETNQNGSATIWNIDDFDTGDKKIAITVTSEVTIDAVHVFPEVNGTDVVVRIMNGTTEVGFGTVSGASAVKTRVPLNITLAPGSYTMDAVGTSDRLEYQSDLGTFPYELSGVLSFTGNASWAINEGRYGLFYDWELSQSGGETACARKAVNVTINTEGEGCGEPFTFPGLETMGLSACKGKFLGNIMPNTWQYGGVPVIRNDWSTYWNQVTAENAGKWGVAESTRDNYSWTDLDAMYDFCQNNGIPFKHHVIVWGSQQPDWIGALSIEEQRAEVEEWYADFAARYPNTAIIDVVNESIRNHAPDIDFVDAIGGFNDGANNPYLDAHPEYGPYGTGWDYIIYAFAKARDYFPNAELIINDYGIINDPTAITEHLEIVNILKTRGLIDAVGIQCHHFNVDNMTGTQVSNNLDQLATAGLPIYVTELDITGSTEQEQRDRYADIFPAFWEHPDVKGVTLWGYVEGETWAEGSGILNGDGSERLAMTWLKDYMAAQPDVCNQEPNDDNIVMRARGADGGEEVELIVNGQVLTTWTLTTTNANYTYDGPSEGMFRLNYVNDGGDRDAIIDYLEVDDNRMQAEDQAINTGHYANGECGGGGFSETMHCNGYIEFNVNCTADVDADGICDNVDTDLDNDGVLTGNDCDDNDANIGEATTWYADMDGDGLGTPGTSTTECTQPTGYVDNADDTNDNDADNDGVETGTDCNDEDDTVGGPTTWYLDADGDGLGNGNVNVMVQCDQPDGYVDNAGDNNDNDADNDGIETGDDCDDNDENVGEATTWYLDADGDGLGSSTDATIVDCDQPDGYVDNSSDNNDSDADNDGINTQDDCNDNDSNIGEATVWYEDTDGDGTGDANSTLEACTQPPNYVATSGDACPEDGNKLQPQSCGCGVAEGACDDCAGVPNGDAAEDVCGTCAGGTTGVTPVTDPEECLATSIADLQKASFEVYPNPFERDVTIKAAGLYQVNVYDLTGVLIYDNEFEDELVVGQDWKNGVYIMEIVGKELHELIRVTKMN